MTDQPDIVKVNIPEGVTVENIKITKVPEGKAEGVIAFKNTFVDGQNLTKIFYAPFNKDGTAAVNRTDLNSQKYFDFDSAETKDLHKKVATAAISRKIRQINDNNGDAYSLSDTDKVYTRSGDGTDAPSKLSMQGLAGGYRKKKGKTMKKRKTARRLKLKKQRK